MQAQEELLGKAAAASKLVQPAVQEVVEDEVEPYDRAMSPQPIDILKLPAEERDIDILTQKEALAALVSIVNRSTRMTC